MFRSPVAMRSQLWEEMLHLYFPVNDQDTDFMYSKFLCRDSLQPISLSMNAAVDALCLIQLGNTHKEKRLLHEGVTRYDAALSNLRLDLAIRDATPNDGTLGAIYVLGFCELFRTVSTDGHVQRTHHLALESMLLERGPAANYSAFAQLLLYNLRHITLLFGLIDRKRVALSDPAWKRCTAVTSGLMAELTDLALCVPKRLEQSDECTQQPKKHARVALDLLVCLTALERDLQTWLVKWLASSRGLPYWTVDAKRFAHFAPDLTRAEDAFPKAFKFPSFSSASAQTTYWIALLHVKRTILEMALLGYGHPLKGREKMLTAEASECAANLCQSAAWLTQPKHGSCGLIRAYGPLHYAARWYAKLGDFNRMEWCGHAKRSIEQSGLVSPYLDDFSPDASTPSSSSSQC